MRQLKDRIVHHFNILPISRKVINDYLMFRMRAAGYKGPDIFSNAAVLAIGKASQGLMRRVNILADKSLLAAFVENAHRIEVHHVQAAIRDSEMVPMHNWLNRKGLAMTGGVALFAATLAGAGWFMGSANSGHTNEPAVKTVAVSPPPTVAPAVPQPASEVVVATDMVAAAASSVAAAVEPPPAPVTAKPAEPAPVKTAAVEAPVKVKRQRPTPPPATEVAAEATPPVDPYPKLHQRLDATKALLAAPDRGNVSIQLFYTDDIRPERMERFLGRANRLGKLAEIYIVPIKLSGKDGYRVLYGHYADSNTARAAMKDLPQRYKDAFAPTLHMLENSQNPL